MDIRIKRAYEEPSEDDGVRILVDRLWPRGISKEKARIDLWPKEVAPSNALRKWYHQRPGEWEEFKRRYVAELETGPEGLEEIEARVADGVVTFVYSSKERELNNAVALREYLRSRR